MLGCLMHEKKNHTCRKLYTLPQMMLGAHVYSTAVKITALHRLSELTGLACLISHVTVYTLPSNIFLGEWHARGGHARFINSHYQQHRKPIRNCCSVNLSLLLGERTGNNLIWNCGFCTHPFVSDNLIGPLLKGIEANALNVFAVGSLSNW